jgi:trigger factor
MQVTVTQSEGLKREFKVVVPVTELSERLNENLTSLKDEVRLKGFRPG